MNFSQELLHELNLLALYDLETTQAGLKVHATSADTAMVAAAERLYAKGLITQNDGGYLTAMGHETAELAQNLLGLLNPN